MSRQPARWPPSSRTLGFILAAVAALAVFWLLRSHQLDLVHVVVVNSVIQKAPSGYPAVRIEDGFHRARTQSLQEGQEQEYLQRLLRLSQRLEKVQALSAVQVDEILDEVGASP